MGALLLVGGLAAPVAAQGAGGPAVTVYKSPSCECCGDWITHLRAEGFTVTAIDLDDMDAVKAENGVLHSLASCHTALVGGYVIEGHVPAADIQRLLAERPPVRGLTAPGMPKKSPGMQAPGKVPEGYDVLSFDGNGNTRVFSRY
ncbi:MAG: DUF411 domain-containing protein [Nitrospirae bacterium]|nr:DUF411 domain-containing protein [Nitrospirota bacterium]